MLQAHSFKEKMYVGLLRRDPLNTDLIMAGGGMNFHLDDFFLLLEKLMTRLQSVADSKRAKGDRKGERGVQAVSPSFHECHYILTCEVPSSDDPSAESPPGWLITLFRLET